MLALCPCLPVLLAAAAAAAALQESQSLICYDITLQKAILHAEIKWLELVQV